MIKFRNVLGALIALVVTATSLTAPPVAADGDLPTDVPGVQWMTLDAYQCDNCSDRHVLFTQEIVYHQFYGDPADWRIWGWLENSMSYRVKINGSVWHPPLANDQGFAPTQSSHGGGDDYFHVVGSRENANAPLPVGTFVYEIEPFSGPEGRGIAGPVQTFTLVVKPQPVVWDGPIPDALVQEPSPIDKPGLQLPSGTSLGL